MTIHLTQYYLYNICYYTYLNIYHKKLFYKKLYSLFQQSHCINCSNY